MHLRVEHWTLCYHWIIYMERVKLIIYNPNIQQGICTELCIFFLILILPKNLLKEREGKYCTKGFFVCSVFSLLLLRLGRRGAVVEENPYRIQRSVQPVLRVGTAYSRLALRLARYCACLSPARVYVLKGLSNPTAIGLWIINYLQCVSSAVNNRHIVQNGPSNY